MSALTALMLYRVRDTNAAYVAAFGTSPAMTWRVIFK
jgi:hypothetical protein